TDAGVGVLPPVEAVGGNGELRVGAGEVLVHLAEMDDQLALAGVDVDELRPVRVAPAHAVADVPALGPGEAEAEGEEDREGCERSEEPRPQRDAVGAAAAAAVG